MNYKKIFKNKDVRIKILRSLEFIPDSWMVKFQYRIKMKRALNLKNPIRYTEKIQWYKLYYKNPLLVNCTDKFDIRAYLETKGLKHILNEIYGVYDDVSEIDFNILPNQFVIKTTDGGGGCNIFICKNKKELDENCIKEHLSKWLTKKNKNAGREWAYYNIKPRIIIERLLKKDKNNDLIDYKFFCYNGEPYCFLICKNRFSPTGIKKGFFRTNFSFIDIGVEEYSFLDEKNDRINIEKPKNYDDMLEITRILSKDFPHVRVDLYNLDGNIVFGELTFYDGSGYINYGDFDYELGNQFILPSGEIYE